MNKANQGCYRREARPSAGRGLVIVHTGDGKGKTSAALNLVYRHLAHGKRASVFFFVKNPTDFEYGDAMMLSALAQQGYPVTLTMMGAGYSWRSGDASEHHALAQRVWDFAAAAIMDPDIDLVVCDELHIALHHGYLVLSSILHCLEHRPTSSHVATTGRHAPAALIATADLVTEFSAVKHPLCAGVRAQPGIEY